MARQQRLPPLRNTFSGVVHGVAECRDCGWSNESRKNALATGAVHARRNDHHVIIEQAISVEYNRP